MGAVAALFQSNLLILLFNISNSLFIPLLVFLDISMPYKITYRQIAAFKFDLALNLKSEY